MKLRFWIFFVCLIIVFVLLFVFSDIFGSKVSYQKENYIPVKETKKEKIIPPLPPNLPKFDAVAYEKKLVELANNPPDPIVFESVKTTTKDKNGKLVTKIIKVPLSPQPIRTHLWPVKTVYPNAGAILPFNRIIAYYGNLYSKQMGALGAWPEEEMLEKFNIEIKKWQEADPNTPVIPALHYIAVVAQGSAGKDGKYRARMPHTEVDKVLKIAEKINAIVFLDFQVAFSTLDKELPFYEEYFKLPNVHLGIDPEFSMKGNIRPGKVVGTYDASDVNFAANFLAKIVKENNLTPKVLVVHRYTQKMLTNYNLIKPLPEVQIVVHMDGWGVKAKKINTYKQFVYKEPVQFTGFKLFYKNDLWEKGTTMFSPEELLKLNPKPVYIQYQ